MACAPVWVTTNIGIASFGLLLFGADWSQGQRFSIPFLGSRVLLRIQSLKTPPPPPPRQQQQQQQQQKEDEGEGEGEGEDAAAHLDESASGATVSIDWVLRFGVVSSRTSMKLGAKQPSASQAQPTTTNTQTMTYSDVGGLEKQVSEWRCEERVGEDFEKDWPKPLDRW